MERPARRLRPSADFARALASPTATVLGGVADGHLVATVMVGDDGRRGWVYDLAVKARQRGRGLGTAMMRAADGAAARVTPAVAP